MRINAHCKDCKHDGAVEQELFKELKFLRCKVRDCKCDHKKFHLLTYSDKKTPYSYEAEVR